MSKIRRFLPLLLILIIPLILQIIWFKDGNIMGVGESGLPFYDAKINFEINKDAWAKYTLGHPTNISAASAPTYLFISTLQQIGFPNYLIQAGVFGLTMIVSGLSVFFLTKHLFPDTQQEVMLLATLLYWFNPFALVNIWNRFLNNHIIFYAFLPVALLLFLKGIQANKLIYILLFGVISTLFSYAETSIAFDILLWLTLAYTAIFYIFIIKNWGERVNILKVFSLFLGFWILINLWWISQVVSYVGLGSFAEVQSTSFSTINNYETFTTLSTKLGKLTDILQLYHGTFFNDEQAPLWKKMYTLSPATLIGFAISLIFFIPILFKNNNRSVLFLGGLLILGVILTKGNNQPFGEVLEWLFLHLIFLQPFRNPFEKFGFLLPLATAPLFAIGSLFIMQRIPAFFGKMFYVILILWVVVFWGFPFWTSKVFTSNESLTDGSKVDYQVSVSSYYKDAKKWLESQNQNFRLIALPIGGEGITYNWEKNYSGVELTNQLLPYTAVSFRTNIPFYENISRNIEQKFLTENGFNAMMDILNAKYIMLRSDIDWRLRDMRDPFTIDAKLKEKEKQGEIKKVADFGEISFWENNQWQDRQVYIANSLNLVSSNKNIPEIQDPQVAAAFVPRKFLGLIPQELKGKEIIYPQNNFFLNHKQQPVFEIRQDIFPHVSRLPSSGPIYNIVLIREKLNIDFVKGMEDRFELQIITLGKRIVEAKLESERGGGEGLTKALQGYEELLLPTLNLFRELNLTRDNAITQFDAYLYFSKHLYVLNEIKNSFPAGREMQRRLEKTIALVEENLVDFDIVPKSGFLEQPGFDINNRIIYKFEVPEDEEYELLWGKKLFAGYYNVHIGDKILLQIDNQVSPKEVHLNKEGYATFGKVQLNSGIHEIGMNMPTGVNLVEVPEELNLQVDHGEKRLVFQINNYDMYAGYTLSFNYWIKKGIGIKFAVEENNARIEDGKIILRTSKVIGPDPEVYDFAPKEFIGGFDVSPGSDHANLVLSVNPWNNCKEIFNIEGKERCNQEAFRRPYDKTTDVDVSNIFVSRTFTDEPMLIKTNKLQASTKKAEVEYQKLNNAEYLVHIKNAQKPFIFILSELFDPNWKLYTLDDQEISTTHFLANGYANGWIIYKEGDYEVKVKFMPQQILEIAQKVSLTIFLFSLFLIFFLIGKKYVKNL